MTGQKNDQVEVITKPTHGQKVEKTGRLFTLGDARRRQAWRYITQSQKTATAAKTMFFLGF